ncbi:RnfH family protein [Ramlibacter tataouinensis]|uniref:UPF0125 protein Rta_19680 n=1 Tax=Ramlibacter tataouinensis (strain ATCC BAA-407 / DSM 14655 / LMG 21543 / TTB310) TaxID=365046 RepID=F5XXS5_RAMTT|nr:RnfH family protein [Ramlibacter tataouinensis]AEG93060.1 conserved hypothetical protein [Ramlibacter tataouinensis TTB310]
MANPPETLTVTVAYSPSAREVDERVVRLPAGARVADALDASGLRVAYPQLDPAQAGVGVWGRAAAWDQPLRERDRVEIWRPLRVDPKVARRERFRRQGSRAAGLFVQKKAGPRAGSG